MKFFTLLSLLFFFGLTVSFGQSPAKNLTFKSLDDLTITADLYMTADAGAPFIILYHQARYSRGEYLEIAPKLNTLGFNCLALDQRSGDAVNGIINETHAEAVKKGLPTEYLDALPDLEATLLYVESVYKPEKLIVWGSSYSSALVFVLAAKHQDEVDGILSFSPGNYFEPDGKTVSEFAENVSCPVFITSSKSEEESWRPIYESLSSTDKSFFLPEDEGFHGSKALWEKNEGYGEYWKAVEEFLEEMK
ncbi:MAG: alpha/beta hydrolase [Bacteroidales bacterium]|nr:alpha/beta hydrolase [Bacteroidales bacterium]